MIVNILIVAHIVTAIAIIALVLLQQGRGADMGAAFGGGSQTLFGARGSANFLSRMTAMLAAVFLMTSMSLGYLYTQRTGPQSVTEGVPVQPAAPATDTAVPESAAEQPPAQESDVPGVPGSGPQEAAPDAPRPDAGESSPVPEAPK